MALPENLNTDPAVVRLRTLLTTVLDDLLVVHKALLDHERARYERRNGPISNSGEYLRLVIGDPWFAWLRAASGLMTQIEEFTSTRKKVEPSEGEALFAKARELFTPAEGAETFQSQYLKAIQESPDVGDAHAHWKLTLQKLDQKP